MSPLLAPLGHVPPVHARLTSLQWVICATAAIGFLFDTYVLLELPLVVRPALVDLLHVPATLE